MSNRDTVEMVSGRGARSAGRAPGPRPGDRRTMAMRGSTRWVFAAPLIIFLAVLVVFPVVYAIRSSFTTRTLINPEAQWAGFSNFVTVLTDGGFWYSLWFTVLFTIVVTAIELVFGFMLALVFEKPFPGKKFLLSAVILPIMIAPALMGVMFRLLLNSDIGFVSGILHLFGVDIALLGSGTVIPMLMILDIIQWSSFTFLLFHASLQSVPGELHEAAQLDRASYFRYVRSILLPLLTPTVFVAGFLRGIDAFRTFDTINVLTSGGPGDTTTTLNIYIYKILSTGNFGVASAAAILVSLVMLPIIPVVVRRLTEGATK